MENQVGKILQQQEDSIGQNVAMSALTLVKPMIKDVCKQLSDTLGDNDQIIVIRKTKGDSPVSILMLNTHEEFKIQGGKIFSFTGNKKAINKYYVAEEFVDMLLTGRMKDLTDKLMK